MCRFWSQCTNFESEKPQAFFMQPPIHIRYLVSTSKWFCSKHVKPCLAWMIFSVEGQPNWPSYLFRSSTISTIFSPPFSLWRCASRLSLMDSFFTQELFVDPDLTYWICWLWPFPSSLSSLGRKKKFLFLRSAGIMKKRRSVKRDWNKKVLIMSKFSVILSD